MSVPVSISVPNLDDVLEHYDTIELRSDERPTGEFSSTAGTAPLEAGTYLYEITDTGGTAGSWYRYRFFHSGDAVQSPWSTPFRSSGTTLAKLRIETAIEAGAGFRSTTTDNSDTSTVLVDERLADSAVDEHFLRGAWLLRPDAPTDDRLRRVDLYEREKTALISTRAYSNPPEAGERYEIYNLLPPVDAPGASMSYDRVIRTALARCWFDEAVTVATGEDADHKRIFDVTPWLPHVRDTHTILLQADSDSGEPMPAIDAGKRGGSWRFQQEGRERAHIELSHPIAERQRVVAIMPRVDPAIYGDDDVTLCPFELAVRAAVYELYNTMTLLQPGKYTGELSAAAARYDREAWTHRPPDRVLGL